MTNSIRYTKAERERVAAARRAKTIARRSALSDAEALEELEDFIVDGAVPLSSGRVIPLDEFLPAWRAGELLLA